MNSYEAIDLGRGAIVTALLMGSPVLLVGMIVGLVIGLVQALTQVQDQTLAFVPKILAMFLALSLFLPWLLQLMVEYSHGLISNIPHVIGLG